MTYFLVAAAIASLVALWIISVVFPRKGRMFNRLILFVTIWVILMALAYLPRR